MSILKERLKNLRNSRNLSQKELSTIVNISDRNYQRYEYGLREPTASTLAALADYYDVSIDYLMGRTDNRDSHKS